MYQWKAQKRFAVHCLVQLMIFWNLYKGKSDELYQEEKMEIAEVNFNENGDIIDVLSGKF